MVDLSKMTKWDMGKLFDFSVLPKQSTEADIRRGCQIAKEYNCKAFCFSSSEWTPIVAEELKGTDIMVGAAIGFPFGQQSSAVKAFETAEAVRLGATVLDNCMNVGDLKDKKYDKILAEFKEYVDAVTISSFVRKQVSIIIFVITPCAATKLVCEAGIDWVKTSTGQYGGPSVQDVMLMVDAVKGTKTKVKVAGVKDPRPQNAFCFIQAGAELIGTRAAVEILDAVDDLRKIGLIPAYTGDK